MKFRTEIETVAEKDKIEYHNRLFFIGSCFADTIGNECRKHGLRVTTNPFGVTYNPLSLIEILKHIEECKAVDESMYRKVGQRWCSLLHHSSFDAASLEEIQNNTLRATVEAHESLNASTHLFITLGTAWVYMDKESVHVVNNCHKIPDKEFLRRKLSVSEIVDNFSLLFENSKLLTGKKIVFTVSPMRHLKDTLSGNSLSKATLIAAVGELCEKYPDRVSYFPSYEIMMDDLRDYRFYEPDMVHPSGVAIEYIYSVFEGRFFSAPTMDYCRRMEKMERGREHRVIEEGSEAHRKFKKMMTANLMSIREKYPLGDYNELFNFFK